MLTLHHERMSDAFEKFHVDGLPVSAALHHFTKPDDGDPHDHPWGFTSFIVSGGYVERVFHRSGASEFIYRRPGDSFHVSAKHIHRIVELESDDCWTFIVPGPTERISMFWQFRDDGAYYRPWHSGEWMKYELTPPNKSVI